MQVVGPVPVGLVPAAVTAQAAGLVPADMGLAPAGTGMVPTDMGMAPTGTDMAPVGMDRAVLRPTTTLGDMAESADMGRGKRFLSRTTGGSTVRVL